MSHPVKAQPPDPLHDAVGQIWAHIAANSADIGDLFERITQSFYTKIVRPGDTVIDGGAHTGRHAIPLAQLVGTEGRVLAFEPLPPAFAKLQQLLAATELDQRVRLSPEALARETGRRSFFVVHNMPEFSGLQSRTYSGFVPEQSEIQVDVQTLDAVLETHIRPGSLPFVKLDLEGGEFRALQGAEKTFHTHQPVCVFENGLASTASDYGADEFFAFFQSTRYELYDILGCRVDESRWTHSGPWYFVAIPQGSSQELLPRLWASVLEEMLSSVWLPSLPITPPPVHERLLGTGTSGATTTVGHVDRVEGCIVIKGWAGDLSTGAPAPSLVVTLEGKPVATFHAGKPRFDVFAATGQLGLAQSGFEVAVRAPADHRVEVHAESSDGTFIKLEGTGPG